MHYIIITTNQVLAYGISTLIKENFPICCVDIVSNFEEALELERTDNTKENPVKPGILLLDQTDLKEFDKYQNTPFLADIPTIVFDVDSKAAIHLCLKCAVYDFVLKNDNIDFMVEIIGTLALKFERFPSANPAPLPIFDDCLNITKRQKDIILLLLQGYSNKEIAYSLNLSYGTVKNYMFNLMQKMCVKSRLELAMKLRGKP